jgi:sugar phosphate isomerase/epimerase
MLLDLIPEIARRGYRQLHICHFHLASQDRAYLDRVRAAMAENGLVLDLLLIDDGDLTGSDLERQMAWYDQWLDVALALGAKGARIGAGKQTPTPALLRLSGERLAVLANRHPDVRVVTENWLNTTPDADSVLAVLEAAGPSVGLLIDLGNWTGSEKYTDLARIAPKAESCHAKCHFSDQGPDSDDFRKSLEVLRTAAFSGPLALIYDGPDPDEWAGLDQEWTSVQSVLELA